MTRILFLLFLLPSFVHAASLHISWIDVSSNEDGFTLQRRAGIQPFEDLVTLPVDTEEFLDTSIFPNVTYTYRVNAFNAAGVSDWSNEASGQWSLAAVGAMPQLFLSSVEIPDPPQDPTLVLALDFEEGAGTATADGSGNNHTGAISGATWTTGQVGNALSFDGVNDYVNLGTWNVSGSALTMMAWVFSDDWKTEDVRFISKANGTGVQNHWWMLSESNGNPRVRLKTGGNTTTLVGSSTLPLNTWVHIAATYNGSMVRLYQDGVQVGSTAQSGALDEAIIPIHIGANPDGSNYFMGKIDIVKMFSRALSQVEIQQEMQ